MSTAPHLAMIVPNAISMDSRVQKVALSAWKAGYRVTLLGTEEAGFEGPLMLGEFRAERLPDPRPLAGRFRRKKLRRVEAQADDLDVIEARLRSVSYATRNATGLRATAALIHRRWLEGRRRTAARRLVKTEQAPSTSRWRPRWRRAWAMIRPDGRWRTSWPYFGDLELVFAPALVDLEPDLIHVHDVPALPAAMTAAEVLEKKGKRPIVVYDAHEWWPGISSPNVVMRLVANKVEKFFAHQADAVITVGPVIAEWLTERHGLTKPPTVVENCPSVANVPAKGRLTLRQELGLGAEVPLFVSSGATAPSRGIGTVVEALPSLPGVHLAIVAKTADDEPAMDLYAKAEGLGVADRVHIRPYVPQESVTWFLESADVGLAPFKRSTSHDSALATKVSEYLVAGLPILGSDCTVMAAFLRETGAGEVFTAESVDDLVRAARVLLADLDGHRGAITPELRKSRTWECQEAPLLGVYAELVGPPTTGE